MKLVSGRVLAKKFVVEHPLAQGGMGSVWTGRHLSLETPVAIKVMDDMLASSDAARVRFEHEARAAARLRSPHVVQILDYGVDEGTPYIVLELLEGEDLRARLERTHRLSLADTSEIVSQLAKGLGLAHATGIVHRDIKPSNVFITRIGGDEVVKLLDFGVAKQSQPRAAGDSTASGALMGTAMYMSPEHARGGSVDHRSDLWSLAVVVFEALTGHRPFEGETIGDVVAKICADELPIATEHAPDLPSEIDLFFRRALCRSPDGRYGSARELADDLARLAGAHGGAGVRPPVGPLPARFREDATLSAPGVGAGSAAPASSREEHDPPSPTARSAWRAGVWVALALCAAAGWLLWRSAARDQAPAPAETAPAEAAIASSPAPAGAGAGSRCGASGSGHGGHHSRQAEERRGPSRSLDASCAGRLGAGARRSQVRFAGGRQGRTLMRLGGWLALLSLVVLSTARPAVAGQEEDPASARARIPGRRSVPPRALVGGVRPLRARGAPGPLSGVRALDGAEQEERRALLEALPLYERVEHEPHDASSPEPFRDAIAAATAERQETLAHLALVRVTVKGPGSSHAVVRIDGRVVGAGETVTLDPGKHGVDAAADGRRVEKSLLFAGGPADIELNLGPEERAEPRSGGSLIPAGVALSVGVVGVGVGAVTGAVALSRKNDIERSCTGGHCPRSTAPDIDSASRIATVSTAAFVVGAIGLAAAAVLFVVRPGGHAPTRAFNGVGGRF